MQTITITAAELQVGDTVLHSNYSMRVEDMPEGKPTAKTVAYVGRYTRCDFEAGRIGVTWGCTHRKSTRLTVERP